MVYKISRHYRLINGSKSNVYRKNVGAQFSYSSEIFLLSELSAGHINHYM
jgi:hypothetical protein